MSEKTIKDFILEEYKNGFIIINTFEGLKKAKLSEIVKQPIEGLLYDLNRNESTIFTFIDNDEKWINDFASSMVIKHLVEIIEYRDAEITTLKEDCSGMSYDISRMQNMIP